jgi:hypothetical protein
MLTRREDWPSRLAAALEEARDKPFKWGSHDCGLFAADCVLAIPTPTRQRSTAANTSTRPEHATRCG